MDITDKPKHTLTAKLNSNYRPILLSETDEGYIPKNYYPGNIGTTGYSIYLDLRFPMQGTYFPKFYIGIYFDIFFHRKGVPFYLP